MRRTLATVAVATLLVLAGCSLIPGGSDSPGSTPTLSDAETPPGVENGRLTNATALLSSHTRLLNESGFETDAKTNATVRQVGEVRQVARQQQVIVEPGNQAYIYRTTNPESQFDVWSNGTIEVTRAQYANQTRYRTSNDTASVTVLGGEQMLRGYLVQGTYNVTEVTRANERTYTTLTTDSMPLDPGVPSNATDVHNYSSTVVVDSEGRVHWFVVSAEYTIDGQPGHYRVTFDLVRTDQPTVERPDWVDQAVS